MNNVYLKNAALFSAAFLTAQLQAQDSEPSTEVYQLDDYIVSAGPGLRSLDDYASPVTVVTAEELSRSSDSSLGGVLDWQPGISASSFAAGASRPILRGFDGPRVRIMESGLDSLDVSATSPDHAVAVEPLLTERIEVLRGPSTLLYGSSAIGGAVNIISKDMPRQPVENGVTGSLEGRYDTASEGKTLLGTATVGQGPWAISVSGLQRDAENYRIPEDAREEPEGSSRLNNSFVKTDQFSTGGSWFFTEDNRLSLSFAHFESNYGVPGHEHDHGGGAPHDDEEGVAIDLRRERADMEFEMTDLSSWIEAFRVRFGYTDYQHKEIEDGSVGTTYENKGWELRSEIAHEGWSIVDTGIIGVQVSDTEFAAIGDEAFTPPSETRSAALFISEHIHRDAMHYELGARIENVDIDAQATDALPSGGSFNKTPLSIAASAIWNIDEANSLSLVLQRSQRAPTSTELYAKGAHLATGQYEIGDPNLGLETAYGIDLTYRTEHERWTAEVSAYYTYFQDYIYSANLGFETDDEGNIEGSPGFEQDHALDTYGFTAVDAQFYGFEAQLDYSIYEAGRSSVVLSLMSDWVRAQNLTDKIDLPRIPPLRIGSRLGARHGNWNGGLELRYAFKQDDIAEYETSTDAYTLLNADLSHEFVINERFSATAFVRANNLLDEVVRNHSSFLKEEAPLPGRNFTLGARLNF